MKNFLKVASILISLSSGSMMACDLHGHSGFMPDNNLKIFVSEKALGGISETQFNSVMDKMTSLYSAFVASTGRKLAIDRRWTDPTVNAYAEQNTPGIDRIVMFGGLARHTETTEDSMALVACHELGHHMGGAPKKVDIVSGGGLWASNEGQADYWGAMKCLRNYFEADDNVSVIKKMTIPVVVFSQCNSVYKNANEIAICERTAMAGLALGRLLNAIASGTSNVTLSTPDKSIVAQTFDAHPKAQCRLDTYFEASLCDHGFLETVSQTDSNIGVCSVLNGSTIGNRPQCWFKP
jgi:hypothetical protein